jgi:hypothetical protein
MIGTAERVADPVLAAMVNQQHARVIDVCAALGTAVELAVRWRLVGQHAGIPMRALHRPRDDMLQAAEDRQALAGLLRGTESLVRPDGDPAPVAALSRHAPEPSAARSIAIRDARIARYNGRLRTRPQRRGSVAWVHPSAGVPCEHMFSFRPSRTAAALLELADAMLAPQGPASSARSDESLGGDDVPGAAAHPHRRAVTIERRRRPAPPRQTQPCIAPVSRTARASDASRRTDAPSRS